MQELTLRQVEIIRAVMLAGTIQGAARLLGVSAPGVSRLVRHAEDALGLKLFVRKGGLFVPAPEATRVFEMIHLLHRQMQNLNAAVGSLKKGQDARLGFASAPSVAQFIAARAVRQIRQRFPDLYMDLNILKIEETPDYLLLERGEFVIMSTAIDNAALENTALVRGRLVAILPEHHPLTSRPAISVHELAREPLVGIDPDDPYGAALAAPFRQAGVPLRHTMRGRFAQTLVSLVRHGLGVSLIDEFSVAEVYMPGIVRRPLAERAGITAYAVTRKGRPLSSYAELAIDRFRREMAAAVARESWSDSPAVE